MLEYLKNLYQSVFKRQKSLVFEDLDEESDGTIDYLVDPQPFRQEIVDLNDKPEFVPLDEIDEDEELKTPYHPVSY
jgi:hypothetical protein